MIYVPTKVIADVAQFFDYVFRIVRPFVLAQRGIWLGQNIWDDSITFSN